MHDIRIERRGELALVHLKANAFLHHMVRNIVGELVLLGQGKTDVKHFERVFQAKDRTQAAPTYSASGLYLTGVQYPANLLDSSLMTSAGIAGLT